MKNVIITSADGKIENFLIHHWWKSLTENVNLKDIDIVILDYGLSKKNKTFLIKQGLIILPCIKSGHIVNSRLLDAAKFLKQQGKTYDQVLLIDGGDIIFQADISHLFITHKNAIRVVSQKIKINDLYIQTRYFEIKSSFTDEMKEVIKNTVLGKEELNAGVIFGSRTKIMQLLDEACSLMINKSSFFSDQMIINYILHRDGCTLLNDKYNYMKRYHDEKIMNKTGRLYFASGHIIPVVHNNGNIQRPYLNFGYGKDCNQENMLCTLSTRALLSLKKFGFKV